MSDNRGWCYDEDGLTVFRAYSLGSCTRSLVAARLGEDAVGPNATVRAAMDASSALEEKAIAEYRRQTGHDVIWQQKEVTLPINNVIVRGHIDGLDRITDEILEVKCFSSRNFEAYCDRWLDAPILAHLRRKYIWQGAVYGHATGRKVRYVIYNKQADTKDDASVLINYDHVFDPADLVDMEKITRRIKFIERCAEEDELPDCDAGCRESDPYGECHIFEGVKEGDSDLLTILARYQELKGILGSAEKKTGLLGEMEDLKEHIKSEYGEGKWVVGPFTANIVRKKGASRLNTKALRKDHPDIVEAYTKIGTPVVQLIVTGGEDTE